LVPINLFREYLLKDWLSIQSLYNLNLNIKREFIC
jgi:hypothetical protein